MKNDFLLKSYEKYRDVLNKQIEIEDLYLPYDPYKLPSSTKKNPFFFIFSLDAESYIRELLNCINSFYSYLNYLTAWNVVYRNNDNDSDKMKLLYEFIDPLTFYLVNQPYLIRNRFIYFSRRLIYRTNLNDNKRNNDPLPENNKNGYNKLKNISGDWITLSQFINSIENINNNLFREKTQDIRHRGHHSFPPKFEIGLILKCKRIQNKDGKIVHSLGIEKPIKISELKKPLYEQHKFCKNAFDKFWILFTEILEHWNK